MAQREESANVLSVTLGVFRGLIYSMFDRSAASATGEVIIMTIMCTRLQDETGSGFLVINLPCESLATPEAATQTIKAFRTSNSHMFARFAEPADGSTLVRTR